MSRRLRAQGGFTVIEVLVSMMVLGFVVAGATTLMQVVMRQGRGVIERWWQLAKAFEREIEAREELVTIHELNCLWEAFKTIHYL